MLTPVYVTTFGLGNYISVSDYGVRRFECGAVAAHYPRQIGVYFVTGEIKEGQYKLIHST